MLSSSQAEFTRFWDPFNPEKEPPLGSKDWWNDSYATGRWYGLRDSLYNTGVDFTMNYTTNLAGNPVGGLDQGFTYTDNIYVGANFDLEKLIGWKGGNIDISFLDRNGTNLSAQYIGNQFTVQQIYGTETIVFYALVFRQSLLDDKLKLKIGRFSTGDDFASSPLYWMYMNNGIDGNPQALPVNTGFSSYPMAEWAAMFSYDWTKEFNTKFGIYEVNPSAGLPVNHGLNFNMDANDGFLVITQWGYAPELFKKPVEKAAEEPRKTADGKAVVSKNLAPLTEMKGLPGHYWMGAYYSSYQYSTFGSTSTESNSYGFYWHADQMVFQETPGSAQGLTLWSAVVLSPQQNIAKVPFQVNGGLVYQGLLPRRNDDLTLFGVVYGEFSDDYASSVASPTVSSPNYEMVFEWGYRAQITKFLYVQPNIQYIIQPGGRTDIPNALVLGAQISVTF